MQTPHEILKQYWGFDSFRPLQEEIIQSALDGKDTLALLPTGGGKSVCFQIPALLQEGICLVVSPLIALMKDQVYNLQKRNIPAAAIYSGMYYKDIDRILDNCIYGDIKFLYLSPERLKTDLAIARIQQMNINLLAVDEAHCISQWGYDFRPPYLEIAEIRDHLPDTPVTALTATATPEVVKDIQEKLEFKRGSQVFQKSFKRDNLSYVVLHEQNKHKKLLDILKGVKGTGVVYVRSRKKTKEIAHYLTHNGISADFYHAGLSAEERSRKQEEWLEGKRRIIVSTNAFGMGIDKPDVRSVVHMDLPDSLEAYFQEAGRGGRDGEKSYAVLLFEPEDKIRLEQVYESSYPSLQEIRRTYQALGSYTQTAVGGGFGQTFDFDIVTFTKTYKLDLFKVFNSMKVLEQEEWLVLTEAVYIPSTFKIKVRKEELYAYQIKNKKYERILQMLLRAYTGAFNNFVQIRESQLASFLKTSVLDLNAALHHFHRDKMIEYRPAKDKPQLIYTKERVSSENLTIDLRRYQFRKQQHKKRIEKAINYVELPLCRSQQLLNYFGELDSPLCGVCDVCLGRTKTELDSEQYGRYRDKVKRLLEKEALSEAELLESFAPKRQKEVVAAVSYLFDEELIEKVKGKLIWIG